VAHFVAQEIEDQFCEIRPGGASDANLPKQNSGVDEKNID
jgi:hypothetical protein